MTYLSDGWTKRETDENGQLKVGYYKGLQGLDIADINAGGYQVDYRLASHKSFEPIPSKVTLPAWKILRAPQLLLSRPNTPVKTDGTSYFVNLLKESIEATSASIYDLEVHVHAPSEAQPYRRFSHGASRSR